MKKGLDDALMVSIGSMGPKGGRGAHCSTLLRGFSGDSGSVSWDSNELLR